MDFFLHLALVAEHKDLAVFAFIVSVKNKKAQ